MGIDRRKPFLYILVALNILPHAEDLPHWIVALALTFLCWSFLADRYSIPRPNRWVAALLGGVCVLGVWNQYGVIWGDPASSALLVLLAAVKLFELKTYRDMMFVTYLCFFVLMTKLLSSQSISISLFMFADVVALLSLMASYHITQATTSLRRLLKMSLKISLWAIPILIIFFMLFPRFQTGFFNPPQSQTGMVGFSDELKPGVVSKLLQSDEVVFRATTDGDFPPLQHLYWRGAVLDMSDGLGWHRSKELDKSTPTRPQSLDHAKQFEMMLEPSTTRWLFALDWPLWLQFPDDSRSLRLTRSDGFTYESRLPLISRTLYRVYSNPNFMEVSWSDDGSNLQRYLNLENVSAPRTQLWINQLVRQSSDAPKIVFDILAFFKKDFHYSLQPPATPGLDEFIFESKVGFCEHFAGAMATMLRMARIPARVVVGFHGGSNSAFGNFMTVRMLDAHAWLEYWDANLKVWRRVDPTAVVAPERLALGAERFADSELFKLGRLNSRYPLLSKLFGAQVSQIYFRTRRVLDQVESSWIQFLLRFDYDYQKGVLERWGLPSLGRLGFFLLLVVAVGLCLSVFYALFRLRRDRIDPELRAYQALLKKLAALGFHKAPSEAPLEFERRVLAGCPSPELQAVFQEWRLLRYAARERQEAQLRQFREDVGRLRLDSLKRSS